MTKSLKKKLLILGASERHLTIIKRAKELGLYTITCDYFDFVPGHKIADESHIVDISDSEAILKIAKDTQADGILNFYTDFGAKTAAYVSNKLGLPGNTISSVQALSNKGILRTILEKEKLNTPKYLVFNKEETEKLTENSRINLSLKFPIIVKPVDSSGSRGVTIIKENEREERLLYAYKKALDCSKLQQIIIEEYIETEGRQLHGDGFIKDGKLVFLYLGDHYFDDKINIIVPYSTAYPTQHNKETVNKAHNQIQKLITAIGFKNGGINVELRLSKNTGKVYIVDIAARNGGNYTPIVIQYATGFNFIDAAIEVSLGMKMTIKVNKTDRKFVSHLILHSKQHGILKSLTIDSEIEKRIIEKHIYFKKGDEVHKFDGANLAIGVLIMGYESRKIMNEIVEHFQDLYKIELE